CPTTNNFITSVEPLAPNGLQVRYCWGKLVGRAGFYGQFIAEVVGEYAAVANPLLIP
ncbi:MAG: hypothetical protein EZS28_034263, partial [Streblomastix strix]